MYTQERQFGLFVSAILLVVALWPLFSGQPLRPYWLAAALLLALISMAAPRILLPVVRVWMILAHVIGAMNSVIILALVYLLMFTPLALFFRISRRDVLRLLRRKRATGWVDVNRGFTADSFRNQF